MSIDCRKMHLKIWRLCIMHQRIMKDGNRKYSNKALKFKVC